MQKAKDLGVFKFYKKVWNIILSKICYLAGV
ncbi:MAG: hypothetical protein K940chlam8_00243 [Chlamydiae bacterium]|nr:hypothetical protein [Chlamydiota bacterium]